MKITCSLNIKSTEQLQPVFRKYLCTVNEKNILIQSMGKEKINSSEIFPIVYSLLSLHIILAISSPSTSLTDFLHVAIYYSCLPHSSILSLSSISCIIYCIISHIIFYGFLNKDLNQSII